MPGLYSLVSIHAPARGATSSADMAGWPFRFQSTRLHEARLQVARLRRSRTPVSIHAPARGATLSRSSAVQIQSQFQSTRLHEARRAVVLNVALSWMFQSTRLHEARPVDFLRALVKRVVSIHAPARGATRQRKEQVPRPQVSIHAPARGATPNNAICTLGTACFNPRACTRRDSLSVSTQKQRERNHKYANSSCTVAKSRSSQPRL